MQAEYTLEQRAVVNSLTDREKIALARHRIDGLTQHQIGQEIGVSYSQVSRIIKAAIGKIESTGHRLPPLCKPHNGRMTQLAEAM